MYISVTNQAILTIAHIAFPELNGEYVDEVVFSFTGGLGNESLPELNNQNHDQEQDKERENQKRTVRMVI